MAFTMALIFDDFDNFQEYGYKLIPHPFLAKLVTEIQENR